MISRPPLVISQNHLPNVTKMVPSPVPDATTTTFFDNSRTPARRGPSACGAASGSCPSAPTPVYAQSKGLRTPMHKPRPRVPRLSSGWRASSRAVSRSLSPRKQGHARRTPDPLFLKPPSAIRLDARLLDSLLRSRTPSPRAGMVRTPHPPVCPSVLDQELAGHQPHWMWPSPCMPSNIGVAQVLSIHASSPLASPRAFTSVTAGVKRTADVLDACAGPAPATPAACAGADTGGSPPTATLQTTPQQKKAKIPKLQKTPQAPGRAASLQLDSSVLANIHGMFMAI
jgi:hypothetical protein